LGEIAYHQEGLGRRPKKPPLGFEVISKKGLKNLRVTGTMLAVGGSDIRWVQASLWMRKGIFSQYLLIISLPSLLLMNPPEAGATTSSGGNLSCRSTDTTTHATGFLKRPVSSLLLNHRNGP
jgi:hypothetical protein